jgi:hypothetical protein
MHNCNVFYFINISNKQDSNAHAPYVQTTFYHRLHEPHIRFKQNRELGLSGDDSSRPISKGIKISCAAREAPHGRIILLDNPEDSRSVPQYNWRRPSRKACEPGFAVALAKNPPVAPLPNRSFLVFGITLAAPKKKNKEARR